MESKVNYTLLGLFIILMLASLVGIGGWLISDTTYRNYSIYYAFMDEAVSGLNKDAPVKFNGVDVGYVSNISINPRNPQQVKLVLKIEGDIPITQSTTATMISQGLTGLRFIQLSVGDIHAPLLKIKDKKFPVIKTTPSLLVRLDQTFDIMIKDFDKISDSLQSILDQETAVSLRNSFTHLETITGSLAQHIDTMTNGMKSAEKIMTNTAHLSDEFPQLVKLMQQTLTEVHAMSQQLTSTGKDIAFAAKQSGSAVQQVNEQVMPEFSTLAVTMVQLSGQLSDFITLLEKQPSALVRGLRPVKPGPGER